MHTHKHIYVNIISRYRIESFIPQASHENLQFHEFTLGMLILYHLFFSFLKIQLFMAVLILTTTKTYSVFPPIKICSALYMITFKPHINKLSSNNRIKTSLNIAHTISTGMYYCYWFSSHLLLKPGWKWFLSAQSHLLKPWKLIALIFPQSTR